MRARPEIGLLVAVVGLTTGCSYLSMRGKPRRDSATCVTARSNAIADVVGASIGAALALLGAGTVLLSEGCGHDSGICIDPRPIGAGLLVVGVVVAAPYTASAVYGFGRARVCEAPSW